MPLRFRLGWSWEKVAKGAKGWNIFPRAKDPDPLFFVHEPFRDPPSIPSFSTSCLLFSPSRARTKRLRSRLLCPPSYPPILLSSCAPCSSLYYSFIPAHHLYLVSTSRATFSLFDNRKTWGEKERERERERRKKAHARCCQSRRAFFRLSQTPNPRLGFRLTDNRRKFSHRWWDASRSSIHHISCAWIDVKRFYPCRLVYISLFLSPWFILKSLMVRSCDVWWCSFESGILDWSWLEKVKLTISWWIYWLAINKIFDKSLRSLFKW